MGIPRLTTQLASRGHWITMQPTQQQQRIQQSAATTAAIVDGPGLAYAVYKELSIEKAADSLPAYSECGSRALRYLDEMEAAGLPILAIFFDGVLPAAKMPTRRERLQRKIDQLRLTRGRSPKYARFSESTFLVPAVIEAIRASKYAGRMRVVPTEADTFCATTAEAYEKANGRTAVVITNDSDMLILNKGTNTQVMMLADLTRTTTAIGFRYDAKVYHPAEIAASVGLPDLMQVAFRISQDISLTFDHAVTLCKTADLQEDREYVKWQKQFEPPKYNRSSLSPAVIACLEQMDPRIAEVANQCMPGFAGNPTRDTVSVWLPYLHEDPGRFDAWKIGSDYRNLAYRILMPTQVIQVEEFSRSGVGIGVRTHLRESGWRAKLETHLQWINSMIDSMPDESTRAQRWWYMGVGIVTSYLKNNMRQKVTVDMVVRMLIKETPETDWTEKHVEAMVQAAVYSIRVLKQLLALEKMMNGLDGKLEELNGLLEGMPGIAELFERGEQDTREFWEETAELLLSAV